MPFTHELIDLKAKPAEFLRLSPTGMVPLLELDDGSVVTESIPITKRIATEFAPTTMRPAGEASMLDGFVDVWTSACEPAYYNVLRAGSEPEARRAAAGLVEALVSIEDVLWQRALRDG